MRRILLSILLLALTGCAVISHHSAFPSNKPISFSQRLDRDYVYQRSFTDSEHDIYFFFHWIPIKHANGIAMAEKQLKDTDGIVNLRIRTAYDPLDYLVTVVTGGLITTYHVEVQGDLVKIPPPTLPPPTTEAPVPQDSINPTI